MQKESNAHRWQFFRAGGVDQPRLATAADLVALENLDQKLWVALSCPVKGLEFDEKTLVLIDSDGDGRVRVKEVLAAVKWAVGLLKDAGDLLKGSDSLSLEAINDSAPEGRQILAAARQTLANLGKPDASTITLGDVADLAKVFGQTRFNGDGVIVPATADDPETTRLIGEVLETQGSVVDRSGVPGIDQAKVEAFFAEAVAYCAWWKGAEDGGSAILPLGEKTAEAHRAYGAVKSKVEDYYARCRLAAFDERAMTALNRHESDYLALAAKDLTITSAEISGFPLARIKAEKPLPLGNGVNPAWAEALDRLRTSVVAPLLGEDREALSPEEWSQVGARFGGYETWLKAKTGASVEKVGVERLRQLLSGGAREKLLALIAQDRALHSEAADLASLERLLRYLRDLHRLLLNFVSFEEFYSRRKMAVFQAGTLYLDGRSCDLCVRVIDTARHATLGPLAKTFLAYCDCMRAKSGEKMNIVAAFTGGDSDNLMVGRNGLFYDRNGSDWDATITRIIENPISIRQAFWFPYKRLMRWIEEQVAKHAAQADAAAAEKLSSGTSTLGKAAQTGKGPEVKPKFDVGVVAALGVAVGGITAALGALLQAFFGLGIWMPLGVIALVFLISGPSMLIAWLKLRHRNLGPLLDANGWAINGRVRINVPFGEALTRVAVLPPGSKRSYKDLYPVKKSRWPFVLLALAVLAGAAFFLNEKTLLHKWFGIGKAPPPAPDATAGEKAAGKPAEEPYRSPLMEGKKAPDAPPAPAAK